MFHQGRELHSEQALQWQRDGLTDLPGEWTAPSDLFQYISKREKGKSMNQNLILEDEKPLTPAPKQPRDQHLIGLLASLLCLAGAIYVLWSTGNVVVFL